MRGQYFSQINLNTITEHEGGNSLSPYFPGDPKVHPNAGVTIGAGVDLGQNSADELRKMGVPQSLIERLDPFLGRRGQDAVDALALNDNRSLRLKLDEASQLNRAVMTSKFNEAGKAYNDNSPIADFTVLPWQAQTVVADLWYNIGGGVPGGTKGLQNTDFWKQVTTGKWEDAVRNLQNFGSQDRTLNQRARNNATILQQAIDAGRLPRP